MRQLILHLVPRVLLCPQVRDRFRPTMASFNQARWEWQDKKGNMHMLRAAANDSQLQRMRGLRYSKVMLHHFGNLEWCEEIGFLVNQELGISYEADPV